MVNLSSRLDFDEMFSSFVSGGEGSAIKDIYNIIPSLSPEQIQIINTLSYYADKWNLSETKAFIDSYLNSVKVNKSLGFIKSNQVKSLLKAYTQDELIRGVKVNSTINQSS